jgi:hypothetical protein
LFLIDTTKASSDGVFLLAYALFTEDLAALAPPVINYTAV